MHWNCLTLNCLVSFFAFLRLFCLHTLEPIRPRTEEKEENNGTTTTKNKKNRDCNMKKLFPRFTKIRSYFLHSPRSNSILWKRQQQNTRLFCTHTLTRGSHSCTGTPMQGPIERHRNSFFRSFVPILRLFRSIRFLIRLQIYMWKCFFFHRVKFIYNAKWASLLL